MNSSVETIRVGNCRKEVSGAIGTINIG